MKVCNVKPPVKACRACAKMQLEYEIIEDCKKCMYNDCIYELLYVGVSVFGSPCAIVMFNGVAEKVPLSRVYNIREV